MILLYVICYPFSISRFNDISMALVSSVALAYCTFSVSLLFSVVSGSQASVDRYALIVTNCVEALAALH